MLAWHELLTDLAWHEILHRHFRPSQSLKWITAKWLTHGKQLQEVAVWGKLKKPPSSRPILIYFEFRSKPSLITVISMDPRPTNYLRQNIVFSYPEMIRVSFSLFLSLSVFCYFTLLLIFVKIILLLLLFFSWKLFLFFHVPGCSGMFWVLSTPVLMRFSRTCEFWSSKANWQLRFSLPSIILTDLLENKTLL